MKLRLQPNTLRLRLSRGDLARLDRAGRVEEAIVFAGRAMPSLAYVLELSATAEEISARFDGGTVTVSLPTALARHWIASDLVGVAATQRADAGDEPARVLEILVEKDFPCGHRAADAADAADTFPRPPRHDAEG